jgi:hypothetical protein
MASIITSVDLGEGVQAVEVDTDPTVELPAGIQTGTLIFYAGIWYRKVAAGVVSELGPHAAAHALGAVDPIPTLPTADQKAAMDATSPAPGAGNPFVTVNDPTVGVFGRDRQSVESLGTSTTTSSSYQTKVSLTTPVLTGTYRVAWFALVYSDGDLGRVRLQNVTDGLDVGYWQRHKSSDADVIQAVGGFANVVFAGAAKTFSIQWRDESGGNTQGIREARIEFWRVA